MEAGTKGSRPKARFPLVIAKVVAAVLVARAVQLLGQEANWTIWWCTVLLEASGMGASRFGSDKAAALVLFLRRGIDLLAAD
jgi:hypothetical protein